MIERGKFRSLTLVNWNGFFARTFDLDELVTTLSGGNGAGKSTTMAAFVTASSSETMRSTCWLSAVRRSLSSTKKTNTRAGTDERDA